MGNVNAEHPPMTLRGEPLTEGEKMTLWVALNHFAMYIGDAENRPALGPIGNGYAARIMDLQRLWYTGKR